MFSSLLYDFCSLDQNQFYARSLLKIIRFFGINGWIKKLAYIMFHWDTFIGNELDDIKNTEINDEKENLDDSFEDPGMIEFF